MRKSEDPDNENTTSSLKQKMYHFKLYLYFIIYGSYCQDWQVSGQIILILPVFLNDLHLLLFFQQKETRGYAFRELTVNIFKNLFLLFFYFNK